MLIPALIISTLIAPAFCLIAVNARAESLDHTADESADSVSFGFEAGQFIQHGTEQ